MHARPAAAPGASLRSSAAPSLDASELSERHRRASGERIDIDYMYDGEGEAPPTPTDAEGARRAAIRAVLQKREISPGEVSACETVISAGEISVGVTSVGETDASAGEISAVGAQNAQS